MPMGRTDPGCASYQHYLIVAGRDTDKEIQSLTFVEILDTRSGQWFKAPPMMYNGSHIRSEIIGKIYTFYSHIEVLQQVLNLY